MSRILVIRFSALGDVAMTIPVVYSLAAQYPQHEITVLSRAVLIEYIVFRVEKATF
mgnify:CR=1 FL=1